MRRHFGSDGMRTVNNYWWNPDLGESVRQGFRVECEHGDLTAYVASKVEGRELRAAHVAECVQGRLFVG